MTIWKFELQKAKLNNIACFNIYGSPSEVSSAFWLQVIRVSLQTIPRLSFKTSFLILKSKSQVYSSGEWSHCVNIMSRSFVWQKLTVLLSPFGQFILLLLQTILCCMCVSMVIMEEVSVISRLVLWHLFKRKKTSDRYTVGRYRCIDICREHSSREQDSLTHTHEDKHVHIKTLTHKSSHKSWWQTDSEHAAFIEMLFSWSKVSFLKRQKHVWMWLIHFL